MCEQGTLVVAFHTSSVHKTMYQGDEWHVASPLPKGCSHRVANFHRYPEGGTSRTLTGPKGTRGPTDGAGRTEGERRRERAKPKQPTNKSKDEQSNRGRKNNNNQRPTRTRSTTKTPQRTHTDQTTPDTQGQTEQAEANNRPQDTGPSTPPGKRQRKGEHPRDRRPTRQPRRTGPKETRKRKEMN